jgi:hypothetical protein
MTVGGSNFSRFIHPRQITTGVFGNDDLEPPVGKVQLNLLAQPSFKADAVAVTHNQHPDHELGINRRPANIAVEGCQFLA